MIETTRERGRVNCRLDDIDAYLRQKRPHRQARRHGYQIVAGTNDRSGAKRHEAGSWRRILIEPEIRVQLIGIWQPLIIPMEERCENDHACAFRHGMAVKLMIRRQFTQDRWRGWPEPDGIEKDCAGEATITSRVCGFLVDTLLQFREGCDQCKCSEGSDAGGVECKEPLRDLAFRFKMPIPWEP